MPSFVVALAVFTVAGLTLTHGDATHAELYSETLRSTFRITPWLLLVPLATGLLIVRKLPAIVTLFASVVFACVAMLLTQRGLVASVAGVGSLDFLSGFKGVLMTCFGPTAIDTGNAQLNALVATRGMAGMLNTVWLIICAMCFGGVMTGSGMLRSLTQLFLRVVRRPSRPSPRPSARGSSSTSARPTSTSRLSSRGASSATSTPNGGSRSGC